jgi:aminoglycoside phosphotransferase (APT) family kinase protein
VTDAEIEITADLVRDLLQEQHPDLAGLAIREVAGGWGNQMWRLGDELAVRMQRMNSTPEDQLKERRWLPVLAPRLPLLVPTPVRFGEPSERFPKHWTVMTWVPGEPLDHGSISRGAHAADTLAGFLQALHVEAPAEAAIRRARGLAAMKSLFLMLMGQNGDRGLPGGKPNWGPAGRAALDRVLKGV